MTTEDVDSTSDDAAAQAFAEAHPIEAARTILFDTAARVWRLAVVSGDERLLHASQAVHGVAAAFDASTLSQVPIGRNDADVLGATGELKTLSGRAGKVSEEVGAGAPPGARGRPEAGKFLARVVLQEVARSSEGNDESLANELLRLIDYYVWESVECLVLRPLLVRTQAHGARAAIQRGLLDHPKERRAQLFAEELVTKVLTAYAPEPPPGKRRDARFKDLFK